MTQKSVIVTGGTQGLGFGYALEFLRRGHNVLISGRNAASAEAAAAKLSAQATGGARVCAQACEMSQLADVQALWDRGVREFGRVDIFLNNAGYAHTGARFTDNTPAQIEAMVRGNVIGSMHAGQVAVAGMMKQGGGQLYLTLGGGGGTGRVVPGMTVYSTTKRAVKYFVEVLRKERKKLKDDRVLIGSISPGVNVTEGMLREINALDPAARAKALKPLNFIGEHVETTTPWIVEQILANTKQGHDIVWLTTGRLLKRAVPMMFGVRRDVLSRYNLKVDAS